MAARSKELQALGQAIKEARKRLGISQERLALEAELDRTFISSIEAGRRNITFASLLKVARALEIKPIEILRRWEQLTK